ncbi:MAG: heavy-metal-associated domain-containing protein [Crocinitomicaceae bacterium]|nr:heavy-metal-associated domain-containing protein [Crocinitomicaceae bacterium]
MTTLKIPFDAQISSELASKLSNFSAVKEFSQDETNRLIVSLENETNELISQILNEISEYKYGFTYLSRSFPVEKMTCGGCASSAERLLTNQPGVINAKVEFPTQSAQIVYMEEQTSPEKLKAALDMLGYDLIVK